jgi:uncharacterized delta-60 repeat protein
MDQAIVTDCAASFYRTAHRCHCFVACTLALVALTANCAPTTTTDGRLDPTFGDGGRVFLGWDADPNVTPYDVAIAVLAPSDGSVILIGNGSDSGVNYGSYSAICIAKLTPAGTFDTSFGNDLTTLGQSKIHGGGATYQITATSAALQSDGKIVIAGNVLYASGKQEAAVWRLNTDGTLDSGFGFLGASFIDRGMPDQFDSAQGVLVVQGLQGTNNAGLEGRIVVAGSFDFDPGLVISEPWIVQLDSFGLPIASDANAFGSNTFDWPECNDGYHNLTFSAIRMAVRADTGALTYFVAGNCVPRNSGGTFPYHVPFIAAVDPTLHLVTAFGNNDVGISTVANHDSNGSIVLASDSTVTGLDVDASGAHIVYAGNWTDSGASSTYAGALDAHTGQFDPGWGYAGAGDAAFLGNSNRAWAILIDNTRGGHASAIVGGQDGCLPSPNICLGYSGQAFAVKMLGEGVTVPYCATLGECSYQFTGENNQGAYAMAYTQGSKVLLAGYLLIGPRSDFAVMRLLGGDEIFLDGFGAASQGFR